MLRLVLGRLASFVPTLFVASMVLFLAVNVVPGSAARSALGIHATPQALKRFEHQHGLDRPLAVQYVEWAGRALRGDFGTSFQNAVAVGPDVRKRIPVTLQLAGMAFLVAVAIAIPLGLVAGFRHQSGTDGVVTTLATLFGLDAELLARDPCSSTSSRCGSDGCRPEATRPSLRTRSQTCGGCCCPASRSGWFPRACSSGSCAPR